MKNALFTFLQFLLFYAVFGAGIAAGIFPGLTMRWFVTQLSPSSSHYFVPYGLLLASAMYIVILLIEVARKRIRQAGPWTTLAFALAIALGFWSGFGWLTHNGL